MNLQKIPQLLEAEYPFTWTTNEELKPGAQVTFPGKRWDTIQLWKQPPASHRHWAAPGNEGQESNHYSFMKAVRTSRDSAPVLTLGDHQGAPQHLMHPSFLCQTLEKKEEERGNSGEEQQEEEEEREDKKKKQEEEEAEGEEEYDEEEFEEVKPFHSSCVQMSQTPDISVHIT